MHIAIIPARSSSKRIKNKNIKNFLGRPIIEHTIKKLINSEIFDYIYVSTDSKKIAKISQKSGALVPFLRKKKLANDFATTSEVISDFLLNLNLKSNLVTSVCCVYPCTPLLSIKVLKKAYRIFKSKKSNFVYPVLEYSHPIQRAMIMDKKGKTNFFSPEHELTRTQDFDKTYHDAGQFYLGKYLAWIKQKKIHTSGLSFKITIFDAIDIDNIEDWKFAENIYKYKYLI